jgi:hypothetical protein
MRARGNERLHQRVGEPGMCWRDAETATGCPGDTILVAGRGVQLDEPDGYVDHERLGLEDPLLHVDPGERGPVGTSV